MKCVEFYEGRPEHVIAKYVVDPRFWAAVLAAFPVLPNVPAHSISWSNVQPTLQALCALSLMSSVVCLVLWWFGLLKNKFLTKVLVKMAGYFDKMLDFLSFETFVQ